MGVVLLSLILIFIANPSYAEESNVREKEVFIAGESEETGDLILANADVTEERFGAIADGLTDDTKAIQKALDYVAESGGGVVFIPAGMYKVEGNLHIPHSVTMRGVWHNPDKNPKAEGTILMAYAGRGEEEGAPFISMGNSACLMELSIWYPEQNPNEIVPYPWTVENRHVMVTVRNITLYNAYNGVNLGTIYNGSAMHIYNVYATILNKGFKFDDNWEVSEMAHIKVSNSIWSDSGLPECPSEEISINRLKEHTQNNAVGIVLGKSDDAFLYDIDIDPMDAFIGIHFVESAKEVHSSHGGRVPYGIYSELHETKVKVDSLVYFPLTFTDDVTGANQFEYQVEDERRPKSDQLINVCESPYNAAGDGMSDDGPAIQQALDDMGGKGGGTVYIPAGTYKISAHLFVPDGVELRGTFENAHHAMVSSGTELHAYEGRNNEDGSAFITLSDDSGVHGISIYYPEHEKGEIAPYPFTIKGTGKNCWVEYVTVINSYNLFDFYSEQCDDFLIRKVWATAMNKGICIGGGSTGGKLEYNMITFGIWQECIREAPEEDNKKMTKYAERNAIAYIFGDSHKIMGLGNFTYGTSIGWLFTDEQEGYCEDSTFFRVGLDTPKSYGNLTIEAADNINIIGLHTASFNNYIETKPTFNGRLDIYGHGFWAGGALKFEHGHVNIYELGDGVLDNGLHNILFDKEISASSEPWGGSENKARESIDGKRYTGWVSSDESEEHWLEVDLGDDYYIKGWKVAHAGYIAGMSSSYNTSDFDIQVDAGEEWTSIVEIMDNQNDVNQGELKKGVKASRVRLLLKNANQNGKAGIAEFQIYGMKYEEGIEKRFDDHSEYYALGFISLAVLLILIMMGILVGKKKVS